MLYEPHEAQLKINEDSHRFRVVACGRRFGKTTLAVNELIARGIQYPGSLNWYVAPTYVQAKQIAWIMLLKYLDRDTVYKTNETSLEVILKNGSRIQLKGADNPDSLRGVGVNFLVVDEVASIRNWDWVWSEVLRPTLTDTEGKAVFIGTPKGFNHFFDLYKAGQEENKIYKSWRFKTSDNPNISRNEIESARQELNADFFAQEYEADFRKYTGLIYKDFNRETHVIPPFEIPDGWEVFRGIDFGSTNPTACLWIAVDSDENWFIADEYYESKQTIDIIAGVINANPLSKRVSATFGDPSGAQWISEFNERRVYITQANKETGTSDQNWVRFKIGKVELQLKPTPGHSLHIQDKAYNDAPKLFVFNNCVNTIREFETYRWKERLNSQADDLNEPDMPEKANDHLMDALSYFACSYKKMDEVPWDFNKKDDHLWEIGA